MTYIASTTDPISLNQVRLPQAGEKVHHLLDCKGDYCLDVHFESKENKERFKEIPVAKGVSDLSNDSDEWFDEG